MIQRPEAVRLSWVRGAHDPAAGAYVNVGDALSPLIVSMVSGRPVAFAPFAGKRRRMAAVGTIGQKLAGGAVDIWGTGCSPWSDPLNPVRRRPYAPPPGTTLTLHACRGPMSARLLSGDRPLPDIPFGDPVALLPRFYDPAPAKRWELGMVLHMSEVADRTFEARAKDVLACYRVGENDGVRLITMIAAPTVSGIRGKVDEILSCRRVASTSLHGLVIAAAYGIPCLHLGSDPGPSGLAAAALTDALAERINARFVDLLMGCGARDIVYWRQDRGMPMDWGALMRAIDAQGTPLNTDADALMAACPAGAAPLAAPPGGTVWDHPLIAAAPVGPPRRARWIAAGRAMLGGAARRLGVS